MIEKTYEALLAYGGPGLAIIILIAAVLYLFRQNAAIQEKRIAEGLAAQASSLKNIEALTRFEGVMKELIEAFEDGKKRP